MSKKDEKILELQYDIEVLEDQLADAKLDSRMWRERYGDLYAFMTELKKAPAKKPSIFSRIKNYESRYFGAVSFDFWPITDWFRLDVKKWSPGKYAQVCVGPIRIDFAEN